jgi:lactate dehydrogenase-like 2-hydroxyacid dehydrogenase
MFTQKFGPTMHGGGSSQSEAAGGGLGFSRIGGASVGGLGFGRIGRALVGRSAPGVVRVRCEPWKEETREGDERRAKAVAGPF